LQLSADEVALLRRVAAWQDVKLRKRFDSPAAAAAYRKATALEALVGALKCYNLDEKAANFGPSLIDCMYVLICVRCLQAHRNAAALQALVGG
jgi:23S rRNA maturation mini-RNase III